MAKIEIRNLEKVYKTGKMEFQALKGINITIEKGELTAVVGPSGSGKSTLLNMITGIDRPTKGEVIVDGTRIDTLSEDRLAGWRGKNIGIVFQFFQLFPTLTAVENVMLPMDFAKRGSQKERREQAEKNLELVGLGDKLNNLPSELSGGEQQRVAIARAFVTRPDVLFADEPTGNLDTATGARIADLLFGANRAGTTTLVLVTHDRELARRCDRVLELDAGKLVRS
jgi:putative ABC transport system ATP-binding protein